LGNFFPNLEALQISHSKLKKVEKRDFEQFPKLIEFSSNTNDIESVPSDLFEGNLELKSFSFLENKITHVGHNLVTPLKKLEYASFAFNQCINDSYEKSQISSLAADLKAKCPEHTQ
jgi:Leucine-rich repeat (LRR) protein